MIYKSLLYLKITDFIVENPFWIFFWNFDPWWPQFWPEPKNDRYDFEMIFSRALERHLSFFSTTNRSRDHWGGGRSNAPPPPPAGGGKSRGPAGRGWTANNTWYNYPNPSKLYIVEIAMIPRNLRLSRNFLFYFFVILWPFDLFSWPRLTFWQTKYAFWLKTIWNSSNFDCKKRMRFA